MRRAICYVEPQKTIAGKTNTWEFVYTSSMDLPVGSNIKFDLLSKGKTIEWQIPQTNLKEKKNLIWAILPNNKPLAPKIIEDQESLTYQFEFTLPIEVKAGHNIHIFIGTPLKDAQKNGTLCQTYVQRRRPFYLYVDPTGKKNYKEPDIFYIDVRGGELKTLKIITPSFVTRNKRFDVIVRFEDEFGHLTNNAPEGTLIDLSYEHLRENLNWQLFVPETGFIALPNLYFNEPGIYKIKLRNLKTHEVFFSPPIKCFAESEWNLFWGQFHGECERFDSAENIENYLRYNRDEESYHFIASSSFDSEKETSDDLWKSISHQVAGFNEDNRFTTFLGFQWEGTPKEEGLRQFMYSKDNKTLLRKKDLKHNSLKKIYKTFQPKDLITIPSFTMGENSVFDFNDFSPDFEKVVEIYNAWGSSECTAKEGNPRPILSPSKKGIDEKAEGSIRRALQNNHRFGFVAGGLDDRGIYENFYDTDQVQYSPGLTAIVAKNQTREDLFEALSKRSCFATTGEHIILGFEIAKEPMGSELNTKKKPGLVFNRYISGFVIGTDLLQEVTIFRNGKILQCFQPAADFLDFVYDDTEPLHKITLNSPDSRPPFVYYYLRVIQKNGHMAWASPIWIDHVEESSKLSETKSSKKRV